MQAILSSSRPFVSQTLRVAVLLALATGSLWMGRALFCGSNCAAHARMVALPVDLSKPAPPLPLELAVRPDPALSAQETLELQLAALGGNEALGDDRGILVAYRLASEANRSATGPFPRFAEMVKGPMYGALVDHRAASVEEIGGCHARAIFMVHVAPKEGAPADFVWSLRRRAGDGAFVTDSVAPYFDEEADLLEVDLY